jgi:hypothetical protein
MRRVWALASLLLVLGSCGGADQTCPWGCPAARATATVVVSATPAMKAKGVQAVLTGPVTGTMACEPSGSAVLCQWPPAVDVVAGTYSLQVSAPGAEMATVQVEVAAPAPGPCGCSTDSIQPSAVTLGPAD